MTAKLEITCKNWRALNRNTLLGFAEIYIPALRLTIADVAVHEKNGKRWAQLPSKPQIGKDGTVFRDGDGKTKYAKILWFDCKSVADAFSAAVVKAVEDHGFNQDFGGRAA